MNDQSNITQLDNWLESPEFPLVVSGPCSAETEEQVMQTARALAEIPKVKIFRTGIWKPRTRPGAFEGVGEQGLIWLKRVRKETRLLTAVEVANPAHVEAALKHEVSILWVGARTVVNPFSVQELAESLRGVDIPLMIKNPVNPDINLWMGAIERFNGVGINKMAAIHRGFYFFEKTPYRNAPMWEIPIELKRRLPQLPIFCDPSHICGERTMLQKVAQKALDLEMDGIMIETHPDPDQAWTDANQQITPQALEALIDGLVIRKTIGSRDFENKLEELRLEIDKIDAELIAILARRMEAVGEIGRYKKDHNITILQIKRWRTVVRERLRMGMNSNLDREFLQKLLEIVHNESIQKQTDIFNKD